jgi:hypothetical protein
MATVCEAAQNVLFTITLTIASRAFSMRDRLFRRIDRSFQAQSAVAEVSRHSIASGKNTLDALCVLPRAQPARAALLICHGIGETVENWRAVQQLLAAHGVVSLVFDYSGYGRSSGRIRAAQCEQDAICAFQFLERLQPALPVSILGFSLGTGIAVSILGKIAAKRLVLCAAYTSLRAAAHRVGIPRILDFIVAPIWHTQHGLRNCAVPVLIVHGEKDRLLPVQMASDLLAACGPQARLVVVPDLGHEDPCYRPEAAYWELIVAAILV